MTGRRDEAEKLAAAHPEAPGRQMLAYAASVTKLVPLDALERMAALNWWRVATWMTRPDLKR